MGISDTRTAICSPGLSARFRDLFIFTTSVGDAALAEDPGKVPLMPVSRARTGSAARRAFTAIGHMVDVSCFLPFPLTHHDVVHTEFDVLLPPSANTPLAVRPAPVDEMAMAGARPPVRPAPLLPPHVFSQHQQETHYSCFARTMSPRLTKHLQIQRADDKRTPAVEHSFSMKALT